MSKRTLSTAQYMREVFQDSLITGIPQIILARSITRKVFKSVVLICSLIGFVYQTTEFLKIFWNYPTVLDIDVEYPEVIESPAITYCNLNGIKRMEFCKQFPDRCSSPSNRNDFCRHFPDFCSLESSNNLEFPKGEALQAEDDVTEVYLKEYGHLGNETLVYCQRISDQTNWLVPCSTNHTIHMMLSDGNNGYRNCYTLFSTIGSNALRQHTLPVPKTEDGEWGRRLPNGTWTGMIGEVQKGEADIAFNEIIINKQRASVVDFSKPYSTDEMAFALTKPEAVPTAMALIHPFDSTIWILTIITFFYSAVLFSILSVPSEIVTVRNLKELSTAVEKGKYKCYVPKGSATLDAFLYSDKKYLRNLGKAVLLNGWYVDNQPVTQNRQIGKKSALVGSKNELQMVAGPEEWKHHYVSEDSILQYQAAVAMKKGYCRKEIINTLIDRYNYAGLHLKIISDNNFLSLLAASDQRRIVIQEGKPLSLNILKGAFGFFLIGLGLSVIVFICEISCAWLHNLKKK
ncbi:Glutamate receptor ionotropic like protein [Argiope bruennichi]|uniref:Glutamate receptor ionotropic like protein n=1 Tax=Argiope bruennichi TaxID=94029 RepID=A0A8T0EIF3_ARGBR|nr:Glutamate receptor ionotropic like protein [Argiope bruennichi]